MWELTLHIVFAVEEVPFKDKVLFCEQIASLALLFEPTLLMFLHLFLVRHSPLRRLINWLDEFSVHLHVSFDLPEIDEAKHEREIVLVCASEVYA